MQYILLVSAIFVLVFSKALVPPTSESDPSDPNVYAGPNCHMCEIILNNVRYQYHNNFTGVTAEQLRNSIYLQCDLNMNGFTNQECHKIADQDSADILQQLQDGTSSYRICQNEHLC